MAEISEPVLYVVPAGVRVVRLDDEMVVFNPFTWETHLLNAAASLVFDGIRSSPSTLAQIEALLADALDEQERSFAGAHAERIIGDLQNLGILVPQRKSPNANV